MEEEAVCDVVAEEVQRIGVRTGRGATDDGRRGEDAAGGGLGSAGKESLIDPKVGREVRRDQCCQTVGAAGEGSGGKLGGHAGAFGQLDAARVVGHGRGGEGLALDAKGKSLAGSDGCRGRCADGDIVTGNPRHDCPGRDAGVGDGHTRDDSRAVADIDDVAGCCLRGADHDADWSGAYGALQCEGSIGEGDGPCAEGGSRGNLSEHGATAAGNAANGEAGVHVRGGVEDQCSSADFGECLSRAAVRRADGEDDAKSVAAGDFDGAGRSVHQELMGRGEGAADGERAAAQLHVGWETRHGMCE